MKTSWTPSAKFPEIQCATVCGFSCRVFKDHDGNYSFTVRSARNAPVYVYQYQSGFSSVAAAKRTASKSAMAVS